MLVAEFVGHCCHFRNTDVPPTQDTRMVAQTCSLPRFTPFHLTAKNVAIAPADLTEHTIVSMPGLVDEHTQKK